MISWREKDARGLSLKTIKQDQVFESKRKKKSLQNISVIILKQFSKVHKVFSKNQKKFTNV